MGCETPRLLFFYKCTWKIDKITMTVEFHDYDGKISSNLFSPIN